MVWLRRRRAKQKFIRSEMRENLVIIQNALRQGLYHLDHQGASQPLPEGDFTHLKVAIEKEAALSQFSDSERRLILQTINRFLTAGETGAAPTDSEELKRNASKSIQLIEEMIALLE